MTSDPSPADLTGFVPVRILATTLGVTSQSIRGAIREGRIGPENARQISGRWYVRPREAAREFVDGRVRGTAGGIDAGRAAITAARARAVAAGDSEALDAAAHDDDELRTAELQTLRATLEGRIADAQLKRLKVEEAAGHLIDKHLVRREKVGIGKSIRGAMLALPARVQDQLSTMSDPFEIGRLLSAEIESLLLRFVQQLTEDEEDDVADET